MTKTKLLIVVFGFIIFFSNIPSFTETWTCPECGQTITTTGEEILSHAYYCLIKKLGVKKFNQGNPIETRILEIGSEIETTEFRLKNLSEEETQKQKEVDALNDKLKFKNSISNSEQYPAELQAMKDRLTSLSDSIRSIESQFDYYRSLGTIKCRSEAEGLEFARKIFKLDNDLKNAKYKYNQLSNEFEKKKLQYNQFNNMDFEQKRLDYLLAELAHRSQEIEFLNTQLKHLNEEKSGLESLVNKVNK